MSGDFLDSNVLIYILDVRNPEKQRRAEAIVDDAITAGTGLISTQVVQEPLNVLTNRLPQQLAFSDALIAAAALQAGCNRLVSEDFQHGQRFETLLVHNPSV